VDARETHDAIRSAAQSVRVLLGQAFYRTEPKLLLELKKLHDNATHGLFDVHLASAVAIFHPKVWILRQQKCGIAIVGSSNLSGPGLLDNIECALYTDDPKSITALQSWFDEQWLNGTADPKDFDYYIKKYQEIAAARKLVDDKIDYAHREQALKDAAWRKKQALGMARDYWQSPAGNQAVLDRDTAVNKMREVLGYPTYSFSGSAWTEFLHIPALGRIRFGHEAETIQALAKLQQLLQQFHQALPIAKAIAKAIHDLQEVPGIGPNLATKLLAIDTPTKCVVVNGPVERALSAFGYLLKAKPILDGKEYVNLLRELNSFMEEADSLGLQPATALDAFFYAYRDTDPNTILQDSTGTQKL
jgi:phospholipase D-like protein